MWGAAAALARDRAERYAPDSRTTERGHQGSRQTASPTVVPRLKSAGLRTGAWLLLCAAAPVRPCALSAQAPDITVVVNRNFRPTAVLLPHLHFWVAVDSAAGGVVFKSVTINPVTFTGWVRVEGIQPGARTAERRPFPDSVRFSADGRVTLLVADSAIGAPLSVEAQGDTSATAGSW